MNVSELARQLRINTKDLLEILPQHGFDIGARAVKVDDRVADKIIRQWKYIKKSVEDRKRKEAEEKKLKEKELRRESGQTVVLADLITVRAFAEKLNLPVNQVIIELMKNGILANQNQNIDYDTAAIMAEEMGFTPQKEVVQQVDHSKEESRSQLLEEALSRSTDLKPRAPVVVVMGHVDHGKTKLLDAIRSTNVIDTESGGITQHIGAYQTVWKDPKTQEEKKITFIDTPGHEAFTVMRSRGAKVADIAIMVVAADDGVKPQTEEVINIIKAAKIPLVVAINKIDKEGADPTRVRSDLAQRGVQCEEWSGDVPMVEISAKQKLHIDKLLDVVLLVADMNQEKIMADASLPAVGTVIESHMDKNMGPVATILVQSGTLNKNDALVVNGEIYGKVRAMKDYKGENLEMAIPSTPVQIIGFKVAPEVGDVLDVSKAAGAEKIDVKQKRTQQTSAERSFVKKADEKEIKSERILNVVVKADVLGSLEAIIGSLEKIKHEEVAVKIVGKGLGNVMQDDVNKAEAGGAEVVGFHVNLSPDAEELMRNKNLKFHRFEIIYDLINWVKDELEKLLEHEKIVTELGNLKVLAIFRTEKSAITLGGRVENGKAKKESLVRVKRNGEVMGIGKIVNCQSGKQEVKEIPSGSEGGLRFEGKTKIEVGDVLEFYTEESKARKIVFGN